MVHTRLVSLLEHIGGNAPAAGLILCLQVSTTTSVQCMRSAAKGSTVMRQPLSVGRCAAAGGWGTAAHLELALTSLRHRTARSGPYWRALPAGDPTSAGWWPPVDVQTRPGTADISGVGVFHESSQKQRSVCGKCCWPLFQKLNDACRHSLGSVQAAASCKDAPSLRQYNL